MSSTISFTKAESRCNRDAVVEMVDMVQAGSRWQSEPPDILRALRRAALKLLKKLQAIDSP